MIVSVAVVMSVDGKLTRHDEADISLWVSEEDQESFRPLVASHEVVIMGRHTYEAIQPKLRLDLPIRRIVLTSTPKRFSKHAVQSRLEFVNQKPSDLVRLLKQEGVNKVLVVGGPPIIGELLRNNLIDYFFVTIEPHLFGAGIGLLDSVAIDKDLILVGSRKLNKQGSLLLKYKVNNNVPA
jgi:dihydrofolate reductase